MSLPSTSVIKNQLSTALGPNSPIYWSTLQQYLSGSISRIEFDEQVKTCLTNTPLRMSVSLMVTMCAYTPPVQLHNALIVSLFDVSAHLAAPTPPPDLPKPPPRKRRRILPYQGEDDTDPGTLRSTRLKRWTLGVGRRERERVKSLKAYALAMEHGHGINKDEIAAERGVQLLPERGGTYLLRPSSMLWHLPYS